MDPKPTPPLEVNIEHNHQEFFDSKGLKETFLVVLDEREVRVTFGEYDTYPEAKAEYLRIKDCYDGWGTLAIVQRAEKWTDTIKRYGMPGHTNRYLEGRVYVIAWDNYTKWVRFRSIDKAREFAAKYMDTLKEGKGRLYQQTLTHDKDIWDFESGKIFPNW